MKDRYEVIRSVHWRRTNDGRDIPCYSILGFAKSRGKTPIKSCLTTSQIGMVIRFDIGYGEIRRRLNGAGFKNFYGADYRWAVSSLLKTFPEMLEHHNLTGTHYVQCVAYRAPKSKWEEQLDQLIFLPDDPVMTKLALCKPEFTEEFWARALKIY